MVRTKQTARKRAGRFGERIPVPDSDIEFLNEPMQLESEDEPLQHSPLNSNYSSEQPDPSEEETESDEEPQEPIEQPDPTIAELIRAATYGLHDKNIYPSEAAWNFAVENKKRQFIVERRMVDIPGTFHKHQRWHLLIDPPNFAKPNLVREFYGNFTQDGNGFVFLRGVNMDIRQESLRQFLHLKKVEVSYRAELRRRFPSSGGGIVQAIEHFLCEREVQWAYDPHGMALKFPHQALTDQWKAWHHFICSNLMPTKSTHRVHMKRAMLLLAIQQQIPIDIPQLLTDQMRHCVFGKGPKSWFFPRLISSFAYSQNVPVYDNEPDCRDSRVISAAGMARKAPRPPPRSSASASAYVTPPSESLRRHHFSNTMDYIVKQIRDSEIRTAMRLQAYHDHTCPAAHVTLLLFQMSQIYTKACLHDREVLLGRLC